MARRTFLGRWFRRLLVLGLAVLALTMIAVQAMSSRMLEAHRDGRDMEPVDVIIVLGAGVDGDGVLGYSSRRRVAAAAAAYRAGNARFLMTTGGRGGWHPERTGAELMADHAVSLGVPREAILLEDRSRTTLENLRFGFAIAEARGLSRVALASDAMHLARARALAGWLGRPDLPLVAADGLGRELHVERAWNLLREALAWWLNFGKVAAWETMGALGYSEAERGEVIR